MCADILVDTANQSLKDISRTTFCKVVGTISDHVLNGLSPTYGRGELSDQILLDIGRIGVRHSVNVLINRTFRSLELSGFNGCCQFLFGWLHQRRVERTAHLQRQGTLGTGGLQLLTSLADGIDVARDDQLAGVVLVGRHADALAHLAHLSADLLDLLVGQTDDGSHRRGLSLAGLLHGHGTGVHQLQTVLERQRAGSHQG